MFKFIKNIIAQRKAENYLVDTLIKDWHDNPNDWHISIYAIQKWPVYIWIANSPYADMRINGMRLPRRWELRKALALCGIAQANYSLSKVTPNNQ